MIKESFQRYGEATTPKGKKVGLMLSHQFTPDDSGDGGGVPYAGGHVIAHVNGNAVGDLPFGIDHSGVYRIGDMEVKRYHRRQGVASTMLEFARQNGVPVQHYEHEADYSPAGRAFRDADLFRDRR